MDLRALRGAVPELEAYEGWSLLEWEDEGVETLVLAEFFLGVEGTGGTTGGG